ncbi:UTP--glucose-1-phosphate uridylyltransferase [Rubripirellula lacrimiformis]|uniref:UTP--glucose-1-phosphate uridylyltransferase n=1 Tax=Rubripirellula lacrimiformis TaxID=1930273 RepID=A0A517N3E1_9BACT|nr:sugar phosphate nucleotidyltransferase [Rubripirellula lacrimiformis]QDT01643.1 UTP--glucose-1-phosphate uridylyltransferase [Rubripirellula lacrimiformis]
MQVRKAVITAAAPDQNRLPLQQLVDASGDEKTALQLIIEETVAAGIEEICLVIKPGDREAYQSAAGGLLRSLNFVEQPESAGYADAILQAKSFVADEPFLHLVGDHLYVSAVDAPCAKQLVEVANEFECSVSAVESTRENNLPYFGIVSGPHVPRRERLYEIERVVEKPTPTYAEQELVTPGLRVGHYLGFFGMHVLTPEIIPLLEQVRDQASTAGASAPKPSLSDAASLMPSRGRYLAYEIHGSRYNLGVKYGLLKAQLAIGLSGIDREQILTEMVDLLSHRLEAKSV